MEVIFDQDQQTWTLTWDQTLLRVQLKQGILLGDYFGPASEVHADERARPFADPLLTTRAEANVLLAPHDQQVLWELKEWSQPRPDIFRLLLAASDVPLESELRWTVDVPTGLLRRSTTLRHAGSGTAVDISGAGSFAAILPAGIEEVTNLAGYWGAETQVQRLALTHTPLLLESRAGKTGFEFAPYVALHTPTTTFVAEILWSGNWQLHVYRLGDGRVALTGGLNTWGLNHRLEAGDTLNLPDALLASVPGDLNAATQRLHDYLRRQRPDPDRPMPVHFNSWYPYQGEPPVEKMKEFAAAAADLGCDTFVQDAGWYTTEQEDPNESWWTRAGDWVVNPHLFPNGLTELSDFCHERGLGFGIWFEPEAISPSAVIRRDHPEWLHAVGGRVSPANERALLNLGVPAARAFIRERILRILRETGATWMKWDFNTNLLQGGWAAGLPDELTRRDPVIAHYEGLYQLQDELRAALPDLTLEMCAGGGGRFDGAILSHGHTNWMSDQTNALINLAIHFGSHLAHPAVECNDWLIEWPPNDTFHSGQALDERGDLAFRTRVAMLGTFGISAPVVQWSADELAVFRTHVAWYKEVVRPVVHTGNQYLLTDAPPADGNGDWAAMWYTSRDTSRGVLFAFRLASSDAERAFALPGLDPAAQYHLRSPEGWSATHSGAELADGLTVTADAPFRSVLLAVEQVNV